MKFIKNQILIVAILFSTNLFAQDFDGYALYNLQNNSTTYLVDKDGEIAHSWSSNTNANYAVFLKDNGNLVRQGVVTGAQLNGAAAGGIIQEYDKDANVVWEFTYSDADHRSHHDFTVMPNGNVLLVAWEVKTAAEMSAAGYASSTEKWPTHIIEVEQDGTGGKIVWEWHIWDHLIQDKDVDKPNYGVVSEHPELMDINVPSSGRGGGPGGNGGDWFHVNGIDYNEELDQIAFSSRYMSEIFIIDHSTTTTEAASHAGGNAGKGGDFLFRYGNPSNYGSTAPKVITSAVHDIRWIENDGRPNAGWLQFFNNAGGANKSSVVDAINPSRNGYNYTFTSGSFQPTIHGWKHNCLANSDGQSASDRLSNGNIFVAVSKQYMYEVDTNGNTIWQYSAAPPKGFRRECSHPGIIALLNDPCGVANIENIASQSIKLYPNPSFGEFTIEGVENELNYKVEIANVLGKIVYLAKNQSKHNLLDLVNGQYAVIITTDNIRVVQPLILVR